MTGGDGAVRSSTSAKTVPSRVAFLWLPAVLGLVGVIITLRVDKIWFVYNLIAIQLASLLAVAALCFLCWLRFADTKTRTDSVRPPTDPNGPSPINEEWAGPLFERTVEIIIGLSFVTATFGVISTSGSTIPRFVFTPLQIVSNDSVQLALYAVFFLTAVQFLVTYQPHFRIWYDRPSRFVVNYALLLANAVARLGMGASISAGNPLALYSWFLALLLSDMVWLAVIANPYHISPSWTRGSLVESGKRMLLLNWVLASRDRTECTAGEMHQFWVRANALFIADLIALQPAVWYPSLISGHTVLID